MRMTQCSGEDGRAFRAAQLAMLMCFGDFLDQLMRRLELAQLDNCGGAHFGTKYWTLVGEAIKYTDYKMQFGAGLEIHITEDLLQVARFDLRVGYYTRENTGINQDDKWLKSIGLDQTSRISFGFGLYSGEIFGYGTSIDYAMTPFGALGTAYQVSVGVQF